MELLHKNIAVMISGVDSEAQSRIAKGIWNCAAEYGCNVSAFVSFGTSNERKKSNIGECNIYNLPDFSNFDGIIMVPNTLPSRSARKNAIVRALESKLPVVTIENKVNSAYYLSTNNYLPMRQIVEHLICYHGMKRINFVTGPTSNSESNERFQAYTDVLSEQGIPVEEERIYFGNFHMDSGMEAVKTFLRSSLPFPEAIVFANDFMALGGSQELFRHGMRIPEDIAVTGFDNIYSAENYAPPLTSVTRPQEEMGYRACMKIIAAITGQETPSSELLSSRPVFRESCGCRSNELVSYEEFRKHHFSNLDHTAHYAFRLPLMMTDLTDCEDMTAYKHHLKKYIREIPCDAFYLCIGKDLFPNTYSVKIDRRNPTSDTADYTRFSKKMTVPLAYKDGSFIDYPDFDTNKVFPGLQQTDRTGLFYLFSPIHFLDRSFGYSIFVNSLFPLESQFYYAWLTNICTSIENVRKMALLKTMIAELDTRYVRDSLTNLYNRFGLTRYAKELVDTCREENVSAMVLFLDLDRLKSINDKYGHEEGDFIIREFAGILTNLCQTDAVISRFGGDEFVVLASRYTAEDADCFLKRLHTALEEFAVSRNLPYSVSTSAGYYIIAPKDAQTIETCIELADKQMYEDKRIHRRTYGDEYSR